MTAQSRVDIRAGQYKCKTTSIIVRILIGMADVFVGGFLVQGLLGLRGGGFIWSIVVATLGAIILLAIYRVLVGQRRT